MAGVALGIARAMLEAFTALATEKTPRGLSRLAESTGVQAGVAKGEARIGSARAYLLEVLREIAARAPRDRAIDVPDRGRVRLGQRLGGGGARPDGPIPMARPIGPGRLGPAQ